jgi:hypothetical protein
VLFSCFIISFIGFIIRRESNFAASFIFLFRPIISILRFFYSSAKLSFSFLFNISLISISLALFILFLIFSNRLTLAAIKTPFSFLETAVVFRLKLLVVLLELLVSITILLIYFLVYYYYFLHLDKI